jgi:hypothetical protein
MAGTSIEVLHRGRFWPLPGASATKIAANAWEITIPIDDAVRRFAKSPGDPSAWDDAVFAIDGVQTEPAVGSGGGGDAVRVTALVL